MIGNLYRRLVQWLTGRGGVCYINGSDTLPPPLSKEAEAEAFARLGTGDAESARQTLIVHNLRLVVYIAKKFESTGIGIEDLISIGTIGLIKAVNTFCPEKNIKLATYASRCIENEILMFLRKTSQYRSEISIDEPLNIDWDGNELLLSATALAWRGSSYSGKGSASLCKRSIRSTCGSHAVVLSLCRPRWTSLLSQRERMIEHSDVALLYEMPIESARVW